MPRQTYVPISRSSLVVGTTEHQAGFPVKSSRAAPGKRKEEETKVGERFSDR